MLVEALAAPEPLEDPAAFSAERCTARLPKPPAASPSAEPGAAAPPEVGVLPIRRAAGSGEPLIAAGIEARRALIGELVRFAEPSPPVKLTPPLPGVVASSACALLRRLDDGASEEDGVVG